MRCNVCKYRPQLSGWDIDECETDLCHLIEENEITENNRGIGCIHNQTTLDKRHNQLQKAIKAGYHW